MEAADFRPQNRLYVAKEVLNEFLSQRVNDRIGLVVFAGAAYTQAPLTLDYGVLKDVVKQLRTRVLEDGTAIGDALATSLNRLRDSDAKSRVVILITDGDNNAGQALPARRGGDGEGAEDPGLHHPRRQGRQGPVPGRRRTCSATPRYRETGDPGEPRAAPGDREPTGGEYYRATDRESLKAGLQKVLDPLERSKLIEGGAVANYHEQFLPFLLGAFLLAALELLLRSTLLRVFP